MIPDMQTNGETLVRVLQEHWIKYLRILFIYVIAFTVGLGLLWFAMNAYTPALVWSAFWSGSIVLLLGHHWLFFVLLGESQCHIIITNRRVIHIHERLLLQDDLREISFDKMKTVEATKEGVWQNLFRYGTIHFEGAHFPIKYVPHPNRMARDIEQAMGRR